MRRSEIFESFVKIAQEKGLISEADHAEHTERDFSETNPRMDSLTIEQISKLYNNKPQMPEGMDYKKNIMEVAHPESLVISPAHDKLNGLIENNIERQNIILRIVRKEPDGHLTQRKYAESQFVHTLVKIANQLDNSDQTELCRLADVCLVQVSNKKEFRKKGQLVEGAIAVAIIGGLYAYEHITTQEGLRLDYGKLKSKIEELKGEHTTLGFGYEFSDEFQKFLDALDAAEEKIYGAAQALQDAVGKLSSLSLDQRSNMSALSTTAEGKAVATAYENLKKLVTAAGPFFTQVHRNLNDSGFRERAIQETGAITGLIDKLKIFHSTQSDWGLFGNFFQKLNQVVENFESDVKKLEEGVQAGQRGESQATTLPSLDQASNTPQQQQGEGGGILSSMEEAGKGFLGMSGK